MEAREDDLAESNLINRLLFATPKSSLIFPLRDITTGTSPKANKTSTFLPSFPSFQCRNGPKPLPLHYLPPTINSQRPLWSCPIVTRVCIRKQLPHRNLDRNANFGPNPITQPTLPAAHQIPHTHKQPVNPWIYPFILLLDGAFLEPVVYFREVPDKGASHQRRVNTEEDKMRLNGNPQPHTRGALGAYGRLRSKFSRKNTRHRQHNARQARSIYMRFIEKETLIRQPRI